MNPSHGGSEAGKAVSWKEAKQGMGLIVNKEYHSHHLNIAAPVARIVCSKCDFWDWKNQSQTSGGHGALSDSLMVRSCRHQALVLLLLLHLHSSDDTAAIDATVADQPTHFRFTVSSMLMRYWCWRICFNAALSMELDSFIITLWFISGVAIRKIGWLWWWWCWWWRF